MRFGLFGSAQANNGDLGPETGQGFRDYLDFNVEAEALGFHSSFLVEHHFTGWNQVSATLMLLTCARHAHDHAAARHRGDRAALAQSGAARRAGGDARSDLRRPARFRHRQGLPAQRVQGFRIPPEEAEARFEEAIEVITALLDRRAQRFSHRGRFWQFEDIVVEPPPAQRPHPPLWVAAASAPSIRRAAARGFNLILDQYAAPEAIGERIALYRAEREARGHALRSDAGRGGAPALRREKQGRQRSRAGAAGATTRSARSTCRARPAANGGSHVLAYADGAGGDRGQCALRNAG